MWIHISFCKNQGVFCWVVLFMTHFMFLFFEMVNLVLQFYCINTIWHCLDIHHDTFFFFLFLILVFQFTKSIAGKNLIIFTEKTRRQIAISWILKWNFLLCSLKFKFKFVLRVPYIDPSCPSCQGIIYYVSWMSQKIWWIMLIYITLFVI